MTPELQPGPKRQDNTLLCSLLHVPVETAMRMELWSSWSLKTDLQKPTCWWPCWRGGVLFWHHGLRIKKKKYTRIETSLGFLEESEFITAPCRGVSRWGSRRLAWALCGRAGWSRGTAAPEEQREHRVRAALLRPGWGIAAGLAGTESCPLEGCQA